MLLEVILIYEINYFLFVWIDDLVSWIVAFDMSFTIEETCLYSFNISTDSLCFHQQTYVSNISLQTKAELVSQNI